MIKTITNGTTPFTPEEVGYEKDRLNVLNDHFIKMIEQGKIISGNYCISKDGKMFANCAIGNLSYQESDDRPVLPDTIFPLASLTKFFTAVAIFKLVEDGKMRVGQKVGDFLEEFKNPPFNDITIAHLLSHTSGLQQPSSTHGYKYATSPYYFIKSFRDSNWIASGLHMGMATKPDTEWAYCSFGFTLLGEIISRVSGEFAHDYIMNNIIIPCEMSDTSFEPHMELIDRYNIRTEWDEKYFQEFKTGNPSMKEDDKFYKSLHIPDTAGGLYSTTGDIMNFGIMLQQNGWYNGKRIIGRKAIEKMTTLYTKPNIKDFCWGSNGAYRAYGLGPDMRYNDHCIYTEGSYFHEGYGTLCLLIDPIEKLAAVWVSQFEGDQWHAEGLFNVNAIIWSGLK